VEVDPGQISQVVHNLVTNAVQAMPGGGRLHVTVENRPAGWREPGGPLASPQVAITVRDEGLGIPASHLPRIFDPYFTTKQQGSGLGLTSAYSIVDQHEGTLTVTSQVGVGSTFTICLPSAGPGATVSAGSHPGDLARGSGRILVMDDESSVRDIALMFLREIGYEVQTTPNGEEAIAAYQTALAEERPFDVVILDLTVRGGMGGRETIRLLKEIHPRVRAIVCSGYSADLVMRQHRDYGFLGCVGKPFNVGELARVVQQVLCEPLD